jgi:salicylate hydroxylase
LERWGLLPAIEAHSVKPLSVNLRSYRDGKVLNVQPFLHYTEERYGAPYLHIHRADFHKVLVDAARKEGVKIQLGSSVTGIDFNKPLIRIRGKPDFHADIVIGADGLKSICREEMLGHKDPPHFTGDLAYRITVKASDIRKHPELRELAEKPAINLWMGPSSHAVCYLLKGGDLYNIVLVCPDNLPEFINTAKADLQEMRDYFVNWDPRLRAILDMVQETSKWRLQNSHEMYTWSHDSGKFTLLGDACHATLPYM